jgi:hypothetical protein
MLLGSVCEVGSVLEVSLDVSGIGGRRLDGRIRYRWRGSDEMLEIPLTLACIWRTEDEVYVSVADKFGGEDKTHERFAAEHDSERRRSDLVVVCDEDSLSRQDLLPDE